MCKGFIRELLPEETGKGVGEADHLNPSQGTISGKTVVSGILLYRNAVESKL